MSFQTDYPPIELPLSAGYLPIFDLFNLAEEPLNASPCQNALIALRPQMIDLGIHPVDNLPTVVSFPNPARYQAFLSLMAHTHCYLRDDLTPSGFGLRGQITHDLSVEGYAQDSKGHHVRVVFQLTPIADDNLLIFDHLLPFSSASRKTLDALFHAVGRACAIGIDGAVLSGFRAAVTLVELQNENRVIHAKRGSSLSQGFFGLFDMIFDGIDARFARGTGHDFANMGDAPLQPMYERLIRSAVGQAFHENLRPDVEITAPEMTVKLRFPFDRRATVAEAFQAEGGIVEDDVHDGTWWTLTGRIEMRRLFSPAFAQVLTAQQVEVLG